MKNLSLLLLTVILATGSSCAYFNTLFNAKRMYYKAERLRREHEGDELPSPAREIYGQVVKKSAKVLKFYPTHSCVDEALLVMGMAFYRQGEYDKSLRKFKELTVQYPNSKFTAAGFLGMGLVFYAQNEYGKATEIFGKLLTSKELGNTKKVRDDALFMMALLARDKSGDYEKAITIFSRVIREYGRSEHKQTAQFSIAECRFAQKRYEDAFAEYRKASKYRYIKTMAYRSKYRMGECLMGLGRYDEALAWYRKLLKNEKYEQFYPELRLQVAVCQSKMDDPEAALATYQAVVKDHAATEEAAHASFAMGSMYRDVLKDYEKAESAFGKAAEAFKEETLKNEALRNKDNIETYNFLIKDIFKAADDSASVPSRFKLAELYLFEFDRPDSALAQYRIIRERFPNHPDAPRAAYAAGWVLENRKGDKAGAAAVYDSIVVTWPDAVFTDSVRARLGMALQGRDDEGKARELFLSAEEARLAGTAAPTDIAAGYLNVADTYPDAGPAAQAVYAAAWTYDYVLGDTALARNAYRRVADTYAGTEYAAKAAVKLAAHPVLSDSAAQAEGEARKQADKQKMKEKLEKLDGREPLPEDEPEELRERLRGMKKMRKEDPAAAQKAVDEGPPAVEPAPADRPMRPAPPESDTAVPDEGTEEVAQ